MDEPSKIESNDNEDGFSVGIDIGGTKIHTALVDGAGHIVRQHTVPTPARSGPAAVLTAAVQSASEVMKVAKTVRAVGVGIPGSVDSLRGVAVRAVNLTNWENVPVVRELEDRLGAPVHILNDVRAGAYAEWKWGGHGTPGDGETDGPSPFLYVNFGTGVAMALIVDGRLYEGASNSAGEFGHSILDPRADAVCPGCGNRGDVESLLAGPALSRAYARALRESGRTAGGEARGEVSSAGSPDVDTTTVLQRALAGEQPAATVLDQYISYLGLAIANLVTLYNPRRIVLGGGLGSSPSLPLERVRAEAKKYAYARSWGAVTIAQARLGGSSGAIGAAGWAVAQQAAPGR